MILTADRLDALFDVTMSELNAARLRGDEAGLDARSGEYVELLRTNVGDELTGNLLDAAVYYGLIDA